MLQIRQTSKLQTKLQNDVKKFVDELKTRNPNVRLKLRNSNLDCS